MIPVTAVITITIDQIFSKYFKSHLNLKKNLFLFVLTFLMFSVPGVKGIEFGDGFQLGKMNGSTSNDLFRMKGKNYGIILKKNSIFISPFLTDRTIFQKEQRR